MSKSADAFRTISEVADWLGIPAHVLRFWESKFTQVKPVKRAGGRRYYRPADMQLLGGIRKLLHDDGMTIKGVQKVMRDQGVRHVAAMSPPLDDDLEGAIAGIALDVTEVDEPRGTVLSFERAKNEPSGSAPAAESAPDDRPAPEADEAPPTAPAISVDMDGETASREITASSDIKEPQSAEEISTPAPDIAAATAAETQQTAPAPASAAPVNEPTAAPPPTPETPDTPAAVDSDTTNDADRPVADVAPDADTPAPQDVTNTPPQPRVVKITVPEDPADDTVAPSSVLTSLAALDAARLSAQKPAVSDLTRRMADLRARMTDGAKSL